MLSWSSWRANVVVAAASTSYVRGAENSTHARTHMYIIIYTHSCKHITHTRHRYMLTLVPSYGVYSCSLLISHERINIHNITRTTYTNYFYLPGNWSLGRLSLRSVHVAGPAQKTLYKILFIIGKFVRKRIYTMLRCVLYLYGMCLSTVDKDTLDIFDVHIAV